MEKFILIDGHSLAHRAFYALPLLTNKEGQYTNAVYGFTMMLMRLLEEEKPDYMAVAFDLPKPTFRHEAFEAYKGHRQKAPDEFIPQITLIKEICRIFSIPVMEKEGFEADDVIGTLAKMGEKEGAKVFIVTGDKDAFQLISENIFVWYTRKGVTQIDLIDEKVLKEKHGLLPNQVVDFKGLVGDKSDNIPGVPGIGEKTALKLLDQFGNMQNIYAHLEEISSVKIAQKLKENEELARLSERLAKIECCIPLELELNAFKTKDYNYEAVKAIFEKLEFISLLEKLHSHNAVGQQGVVQTDVEVDKTCNVSVITSFNEAQMVIDKIRSSKECTYHFILDGNDPLNVPLLGLGLKPLDEACYYISFIGEQEPVIKEKLGWFREIFERRDIILNCVKSKQAYEILRRFDIQDCIAAFDPLVAAYLLEPSQSEYSIKQMAAKYLRKTPVLLDDLIGKCKKYTCLNDVTSEETCYCVAAEIQCIEALKPILQAQLEKYELIQLFKEIEMPLTYVLGEMEFDGIIVDTLRLDELKQEMQQHLLELEEKIFALAGEKINLNSPKQLGELLFERMQIPPVKKTKTGYSTDAEVLEHLATQYDIAALILEYRQIMKLKSTYVDGLKKLINIKTGRIHTTFNQLVTTTGRLSSMEPNLQNIPIRTAEGRKIREVFIPQKGCRLLAADYSQIELRILAHLSDDTGLKAAFIEQEDIHTKTAAEVFGVTKEQVTPEMRRRAKAVNFGIIYGISDYGLSRDLKISRKEAKHYIETYFSRYPGVKAYMEKAIEEARENGFASTLLKRRRYLTDLNNKNKNIRSFAERTAMNTPIQGSAADLIKIAMIDISETLAKHQLKTRMLLQVHDELIFETPESELEQAARLIKEKMENALSLSIPLIVELKCGYNWNEMNPIKM